MIGSPYIIFRLKFYVAPKNKRSEGTKEKSRVFPASLSASLRAASIIGRPPKVKGFQKYFLTLSERAHQSARERNNWS